MAHDDQPPPLSPQPPHSLLRHDANSLDFDRRHGTIPNATPVSAEDSTSKLVYHHETEARFTTLTLVLQQRNPEPAPKSNPKQTLPVESAHIISPSDLVVVRSLGTRAVPVILASAHPLIP